MNLEFFYETARNAHENGKDLNEFLFYTESYRKEIPGYNDSEVLKELEHIFNCDYDNDSYELYKKLR